jgi:lactoylglutathione lyase
MPAADPPARARLVGINHVALEVGDLEAALAFYGRLLGFELRGRYGSRMAFLDAGDQFLALSVGRRQPADDERHFGLVVDDLAALRASLDAAGVAVLPERGVNFRDPWGNRIQAVQYDAIQFTKAPAVLRGMGLGHLTKTPAAREELRAKGMDTAEEA